MRPHFRFRVDLVVVSLAFFLSSQLGARITDLDSHLRERINDAMVTFGQHLRSDRRPAGSDQDRGGALEHESS
jgi:hypothetical protein